MLLRLSPAPSGDPVTAPREVTAANVTDEQAMAMAACPICTSAPGTQCYFDAFERLGADGQMRNRSGEVHRARIAAGINARASKAGAR